MLSSYTTASSESDEAGTPARRRNLMVPDYGAGDSSRSPDRSDGGMLSPAMMSRRKALKQKSRNKQFAEDRERIVNGFTLDKSSRRSNFRSEIATPVAMDPDECSTDAEDDGNSLEYMLQHESGRNKLNFCAPIEPLHTETPSYFSLRKPIIVKPAAPVVPRDPTPPPLPPPPPVRMPSISSSSTPLPEPEPEPEPEVKKEPEVLDETSSSSSEPPLASPLWARGAEEEEMDPIQFNPFFKSPGMKLNKSVLALSHYRSKELAAYSAFITCDPDTPCLKVKLVEVRHHHHLFRHDSEESEDSSYREITLMPDLLASYSIEPSSLSAFEKYQLPKHMDITLDEIKAHPGVCTRFRNARGPMWLGCKDEAQQTVLCELLRVARRLSREHKPHDHHIALPVTVPLPTLVNGPKKQAVLKKLPNYEERMNAFGVQLNAAAALLDTSKAVSKYWKNEQVVWVAFWSPESRDWKRKHLRAFVHAYMPTLVLVDRICANMNRSLQIDAHSVLHLHKITDAVIPSPVKEMQLDEHVVSIGVHHQTEGVFVSFKSYEDAIDLQQVIATLAYLRYTGNEITGDMKTK